jgi:hypothetical protein
VEWYWQRKTKEPGEKPVLVPPCPLQIPHGLIPARTRPSAVRSRRLTAWATEWPSSIHVCLYRIHLNLRTCYQRICPLICDIGIRKICQRRITQLTHYCLLLRGGIVQSVPCTAAIFWFTVRPHVSSNHSWLIHQSTLANTSEGTY